MTAQDNSHIRVGIIGAGQNTKNVHIPNLQAIPGVEILEVANRTIKSAKQAAREFKIPVVRERWQEVATSKELDAVVIGTWPYLHCQATCMALKTGKHVLCEARMAMNVREAEQMLRASRERPDKVVQIVPSPFTLKVDSIVKEYLDKNKLGKINYFHFDYQSSPFAPVKPNSLIHWRRNKNYSGLNTMVLGIAYESILRWLGPAQWVRASGKVFKDKGLDPDTRKVIQIEIPDYLSVQMEMGNGIMGSFLISDIALHGPTPKIEIFGDQGTLRYLFAIDGELYFSADPDEDPLPVFIPPESQFNWQVEKEFVKAIRGKEKIKLTTFETGVEYMRFTEAVHESLQMLGERIEL